MGNKLENLKKRKIGLGMHPRGQQTPNKPAPATAEVSADEGQQEAPKQVVEGTGEAVQSGSRLEADSVQNLESTENSGDASVATAGLEDLMRDSVDALTPNEVRDKNELPASFEGGIAGHRDVVIATKDHALLPLVGTVLGEQPDGTFKMIVTVPEGHMGGIISQAESDGVTPETWLSTRLADYLESWWAPPVSR